MTIPILVIWISWEVLIPCMDCCFCIPLRVLTDSLNDYFPNYGSARKSMLASENGDLGSIENGRYSLSGADYLKNDFENSSYLSFGQDSFSNLSDVQLSILLK